MYRSILPLVALSVFAAQSGLASTVDASTATATADADARRRALKSPVKDDKKAKAPAVPTLYEGEIDDIGPQLLLLEAAAHEWFAASADLQNYYTSNATLGQEALWSDVSVITAQAGVNAKPIKFGTKGAALAFSTGYRYQQFQYGLLSGRSNHDIANSAGVKLDRLNFSTHTLFLNGEWSKGGWSAGSGVRYTAFIQNSDDKTSYQEYAPSVHGGYRWTIGERNFINVDADATYRFTRTPKDAGGFSVEGDRNDRYDLGLNLSYAHIIGEHVLIQPAYRFQYTDYTEGGAAQPTNQRVDTLNTFSLTLGYYFNKNFSVRTFGSVEFRHSNEAENYSNYNLGAGVMASVTF